MKRNWQIGMGALGILALTLAIVAGLEWRQITSLNHDLAALEDMTIELKGQLQASEEQRLADREELAALADEEKSRLQDSLRLLQSELDREKERAAKERERLVGQLNELKSTQENQPAIAAAIAPRSTALEPQPAPAFEGTAIEETSVADDDASTKTADKQSPMSQMAKMMKNPAMREMIRSQQKSLMDMTYKSLYDSLNIPEDQMSQLKDLLLDKQMKQVDLGIELMGGDATKEDREDLTARIEAANAEYDKAIQELLTDKDYEWYKAYEETKNERMQLNMFNQSLGEGDRLSVEQEDALTLAMFDARSNYKSLNELQDPGAMEPGKFSPEMIDKLLADLKAVNEQYVLHAADILNPNQLEQFRSYLEQQQAMQEMGLRMAGKMFGEQK